MAYHKRQTHIVGRCWVCNQPVRAPDVAWVDDYLGGMWQWTVHQHLVHAGACHDAAEQVMSMEQHPSDDPVETAYHDLIERAKR